MTLVTSDLELPPWLHAWLMSRAVLTRKRIRRESPLLVLEALHCEKSVYHFEFMSSRHRFDTALVVDQG